MTNSTMLLSALESGDTSDATVSAALDALIEEGAGSLMQALRDVVRAVDAGLEAREIAAGCSTIEVGAPHRDRLLKECRDLSLVPSYETASTFVQPGGNPPSAYRSANRDTASGWGAWQVFVGALWLLARDQQLTGQHNARQKRRATRSRE